jgi:dUTP pyrophosphatase
MHINQLITGFFKRLFRRPEVTLPIIAILTGLTMFWFSAEAMDFMAVLLSLVVIAYIFHLRDNPDPITINVVNTPAYFRLPEYKTEGASGLDVYYIEIEDILIDPGRRVLIPTGLFVDIPPGYEFQVRPRSGLAWNDGITVLNSPGTIDSDYRGEIKVMLINHSKELVTIKKDMRICQLVLTKIEKVQWNVVQPENISTTDRGDGGIGHTGK